MAMERQRRDKAWRGVAAAFAVLALALGLAVLGISVSVKTDRERIIERDIGLGDEEDVMRQEGCLRR